MIATLVTLFIAGLVGLLVVALVLAVVGAVFGIAFGLVGFLLFKVVPILIVGYLIVKFLTPRHKKLSSAERRWLEEA